MLLAVFAAFLTTVHVSSVLGGQVPVINNIPGGVPERTLSHKVNLTTTRSISAVTPGKLRVVENSGVCETTPGVYQASGYGDLTSSESIWFWFFAARNNPATKPVALWFNGGPGSSSMLGLLQEMGPCRITNDSKTVTSNPNAWNNEVNMLYIDQPVGVGFSYGTTTVRTSQEAASDVWKFLQIFFADPRFSKYSKRELALWTESYGGHYGPAFAAHFLSQNAAIDAGKVNGTKLNLQVLAIGNGLTDALIQYPSYLSYAASNPYHRLVSDSVIKSVHTNWTKPGGCKAQIEACRSGNNTVCSDSQGFCNEYILLPLAGDWDVYYVPTPNPDPYPPNITTYINSLAPKIGAESTWQETNLAVYLNFAATGDWMRNSAPDLETVIKAGVRTLIYDGDADYIVNYKGVEAMVDRLETQFSELYRQQSFAQYTVRGHDAGLYKNAGTFSYVRIFGAGHQVPAYKYRKLTTGEVALQFFSQIMAGQQLRPT